MSYSFIVIDKKGELNVTEFIEFCKNNYNDYEILYCTCSKNKKHVGLDTYVFEDNANVEEMINSVVYMTEKKNIVVIRDVTRYKNIKSLTDKYNKNNQIVYFNKKQSKFKLMCFNFIKNTIAKLFSHNLINMDHSLVLYGEVATRVLQNIKSPSILMRTNNWTGINYVELDGDFENSYKFAYKKKNLALATLIPLGCAILFIVLALTLFKMNLTMSLVGFAVILILITISFIYGSKWILNKILGDNISNDANYEFYFQEKESTVKQKKTSSNSKVTEKKVKKVTQNKPVSKKTNSKINTEIKQKLNKQQKAQKMLRKKQNKTLIK